MSFRHMHRKHLALLSLGVAVLSLFSVLRPVPVMAATPAQASDDGFNLTLSPLPVGIVAAPGQTVSTPIRVQNSGPKPVRIKASIMKFKADGETGKPVLEEPTAKDEYIKWASFSENSFIAQPNVYNTVTMTIKVPKSAAFGYYYAAVFSQDNGNSAPTGRTSRINGAVASLILLDVQAPGEKRALAVTRFRSEHTLYQYLPATFDITVKNTGNVHVIPTGNIFIGRHAHGPFIDTLTINDSQGNILPKSSREFTVDWGNGFPNYKQQRQNGQILADKNGKPIEKLDWSLANADKLRFGRYVASMTLVYNDGKRDIPVNAQVVFWVIPWIPVLILLVILTLTGLGIGVLIRSGVRKVKHRRNKRSK